MPRITKFDYKDSLCESVLNESKNNNIFTPFYANNEALGKLPCIFYFFN